LLQLSAVPSSAKFAEVASVVRSRVCGNEASRVSVPGLYVPSVSGQDASAATQVRVFTGMVTIAFAVPLEQVSATPLPTVISRRPELSVAGPEVGQHVGPVPGPVQHANGVPTPVHGPAKGTLQIEVVLVSPTSLTVKSDPPFESISPMPQPLCVTLVVAPRAGTQKFGVLKPPGNGTTVWCTQFASPALTS
jgi:hypothetical protein